jgi:hypothetical protein
VGQGFGTTGATARIGRLLDAAVPGSLLNAGLPPRKRRAVRIDTLPLTEGARAALSQAGRGRAAVDVYLSPDLFLRRRVDLPAVARRDLAGAVAIQMRQSMPGQAEGLVWRHVPVPGGADVFVLKQARLTELLREAGVTLRRVVIDGVDAPPLIDARAQTDAPERFWNRTAPLAVLALLLAVLAAQGWRLYGLKAALAEETARVATLRDTAAAARAEAESQNAIGTARMADMERLARENRRLPLLADLTRVLGDEVWLSNLALEADILRLSGFSEIDMAQVVAAIRPLPWVAGVDLDGAVTLDDASGARRFLLNVRLAKGGEE